MITFFHVADLHIGVENYGKMDTKTGIHSRLLDFKNSLNQCVELAIKQKIDFFLFCGDAYKTAYPTPTQQKILIQAFFKLKDVGIPVVSVVGNHDHPLSFGKSNAIEIFDYVSETDFYVFSKPGVLTLETKSGPIQIVGIPWPTRNNIVTSREFHLKGSDEITTYLSQAVGTIIKSFEQKLDPTIPANLAGHLTVSTGVFSGSERCAVFGNDPVFLPSQLALPIFDYVALGHLHRHQNVNPHGHPSVIYSGSIERIDFGERKDTKGFCCVKIDEKEVHQEKRCSFEFIKLKTRPMIQIEIKLEVGKDQTEQVLEKIATYDITDAIVKIIYHIPEGKKDRVDLKVVQKACAKAIHVVSITPVRKQVQRTKRAILKVDMQIEELLETYFNTKGYEKKEKERLLQKAQKIIDQSLEG
jgi:exonuclease SbcD